jgi:hypothetical protein
MKFNPAGKVILMSRIILITLRRLIAPKEMIPGPK